VWCVLTRDLIHTMSPFDSCSQVDEKWKAMPMRRCSFTDRVCVCDCVCVVCECVFVWCVLTRDSHSHHVSICFMFTGGREVEGDADAQLLVYRSSLCL